jgi:hypothetical protein
MLFFILVIQSLWAFELPRLMTPLEQTQTLEVVGLGSSTKFLNQAYPLGGHSGLEVGLTTEFIPTHRLKNMGQSSTAPSGLLLYPSLNVSKGIYSNSEINLNFSPYTSATQFSRYGVSFRWGFYQGEYYPISLSVVAHASSANISNQLITRNVGGDLMLGITRQNFSLSMGAGWASTAGRFSGGSDGLTISQMMQGQKVDHGHLFLGGTYHFEPLYVGLAVDRYLEEVYSFKVGVIF